MAIITSAGESLIASQQAAGQNLVIDKIIFANINGLDETQAPPKSEGKPSAGDIVATESITQTGVVNANTVVYSITMPSTMGTWSFNWMGLYSSAHDTVVAIAYTPIQEKRATVGDVLGNVYNKNFAIEFVGAADTTGITIDAQSWQIDYTARLESMDKLQRQAVKNIYGPGVFLNDGFQVTYNGSDFILKAGTACVGGLFIQLDADQVLNPGALPQAVWLDVYQQKTMAGIENTFDVVLNNGALLTDYTSNGIEHSLVKVATINAANDITNERMLVNSFDVYHQGNTPTADTTKHGFAKLIDSVTSTSTVLAATAKAVKTAYDKAVQALGVANSKANASHSHTAGDLPTGSTSAKGLLELLDSVSSTSTTKAATPKSVKTTYDLANSKANASHSHTASDLPNGTTTAKGILQLIHSVSSTSTTLAATAGAVKSAYDKAVQALNTANSKANASHTHTASDLPNGSTTAKGILQLINSVTSTSTTLAATAGAVKTAYDKAVQALNTANSKANASHGHSISDVSGLQSALDSAGGLKPKTVLYSGSFKFTTNLTGLGINIPIDSFILIKWVSPSIIGNPLYSVMYVKDQSSSNINSRIAILSHYASTLNNSGFIEISSNSMIISTYRNGTSQSDCAIKEITLLG